jgi:transcriptional regulator NrdR family protein
MLCPYCNTSEQVRVTHTKRKGAGKRRRYHCAACNRYFYKLAYTFDEERLTPAQVKEIDRLARG